MKTLFRTIVNWFKNLFAHKQPKRDESLGTSTVAAPTPKEMEEAEEKLRISYKQYRRAMLNRGDTPATFKGWQKAKHPLHAYHFGTFSPIKPIARRVH